MRINLWGGPGLGKSNTASRIYSILDAKQINIQLCREYIKNWVYQQRAPRSFDQVYIFGKQLHSEDLPLQGGVEHIVTDSPLLMSVWYASSTLKNTEITSNLLGLAREFERQNPSINIFLDREGIKYQPTGRFQTEDEAREMDKSLFGFAFNYLPEIVTINARDIDAIINYVEPRLN